MNIKRTTEFSLMVHGGSGNVPDISPFRDALSEALEEGGTMLRNKKNAAAVAFRCITILENHPRLNAGIGSALTEAGTIEMEAAIMNGVDLSAGAVAGIHSISNPIEVADLIRRDPNIVKLVGDGALAFTRSHGIELVPDESLMTDRQIRRWEEWRIKQELIIDGDTEPADEGKLGTVGAVVYDRFGNLASATSTGGLVGKKLGRVGDTSTIGAGTYANRYLAVSATGRGEDFVRLNISGRAALQAELGASASEAAQDAVTQLETVQGKGGVIMIDQFGRLGSAKTKITDGLVHGALTSDMDQVISLDPRDVSAN